MKEKEKQKDKHKYELTHFTFQEEFDRFTGYWWSPRVIPPPPPPSLSSSCPTPPPPTLLYHILFTRVDEEHVPSVTIPSYNFSGSEETHRYPRAGEVNPSTSLHLLWIKVSVDTSEIVDFGVRSISKHRKLAEWISKWAYITRCGWLGDGESVWIQVLNRTQQERVVVSFSIEEFNEEDTQFDERSEVVGSSHVGGDEGGWESELEGKGKRSEMSGWKEVGRGVERGESEISVGGKRSGDERVSDERRDDERISEYEERPPNHTPNTHILTHKLSLWWAENTSLWVNTTDILYFCKNSCELLIGSEGDPEILCHSPLTWKAEESLLKFGDSSVNLNDSESDCDDNFHLSDEMYFHRPTLPTFSSVPSPSPSHPPPSPSPSSSQCFSHLYYMSHPSAKPIPLTKGAWEITKLIRVDEEKKSVYFMGTMNGPLEQHLYVVSYADVLLNSQNGEMPQVTRLTTLNYFHRDVFVDPLFCFFLTNSSNVVTPLCTIFYRLHYTIKGKTTSISATPYLRLTLPNLDNMVSFQSQPLTWEVTRVMEEGRHTQTPPISSHWHLADAIQSIQYPLDVSSSKRPTDVHSSFRPMDVPSPDHPLDVPPSEYPVGYFITPRTVQNPYSFESKIRFPIPLITYFSVQCPATSEILYGWYAAPDTPGPHPTLLWVYGGPHVQQVKNTYPLEESLRQLLYASIGFAVVMVDGVGSSCRGMKFASHLQYRMGTSELPGYVAALSFLSKHRNIVDRNRICVSGSSYGGYLSLMFLGQRPDIFRLSIPRSPVTLWECYDTAYTERYMGLPQIRKMSYIYSQVLSYVDRFPDERGRLLLIHGLRDENVHFTHTAMLLSRLVQSMKPYEIVVFPSERHGVRDWRAYVYQEASHCFFMLNLLKHI
jgi:acetyl esterase/lipase